MDQMDPVGVLKAEELLRFFHCKKTEMSCMENPQTFLNQLRDHDLIPEDRYKRLTHMRSKENLKRGIYQALDELERERWQHIRVFWGCVMEETIINQYPTLRLLRNSLVDGSFRAHVPEKVEKESKRKELSDEEDDEGKQLDPKKRKGRRVFDDDDDDDDDGQPGPSSQFTPCQKKSKKEEKKKLRSGRVIDDDGDDDDEQPGPSSQFTPRQKKKSKKIPFSSPIKKGGKNDVWTWPFCRTLMPVTCGELEGSLNKKRLAKGERCIYFNKQWFTPGEFERRAGMTRMKNWKWSIRCRGTPLGKLIQEEHLKSATYQRGSTKAKKSLFPPVTGEDEREDEESDGEEAPSSSNKESSTDHTDEESEQQQRDDDDVGTTVFKVTCGAAAGTLHKKRFASGTHGKSIRTERSWMSPKEFVNVASCKADASWKKDIKWEGKPLSVLIKKNILGVHSVLCDCSLCSPDQEHLDNERNDDECCVCRSEEEARLVVCDGCPRSFHQECHLPHIEDAVLGDDRPWMCTFCEFSHYGSGEELEMQAAMSQYISRHKLKCQYLLLFLCSADEQPAPAPNPHDCLQASVAAAQAPTWFDEVASKLQKEECQTVGEFVSDVQLAFTGRAENSRGDDLVARGDRLKKLFDGEFKKVFSIREQTDD